MKRLTCIEHKSESYAPRTYHNASQGVTLAIATDFTTAGEKLTHKAAKGKIVQIPYGEDTVIAARKLYVMLKKYECKTLNVAGNGIYTLIKKGVDQEIINQYVYNIVSLVHKHWPLDKIVSGGQTGVDTAGLVTGCALDIETIGTWPKGFLIRSVEGKDIYTKPQEIKTAVYYWVKELKSNE